MSPTPPANRAALLEATTSEVLALRPKIHGFTCHVMTSSAADSPTFDAPSTTT